MIGYKMSPHPFDQSKIKLKSSTCSPPLDISCIFPSSFDGSIGVSVNYVFWDWSEQFALLPIATLICKQAAHLGISLLSNKNQNNLPDPGSSKDCFGLNQR